VYNGKYLNQVEIKTEMIGHSIAEFSLSQLELKPVKHGRPGYRCYALLKVHPKDPTACSCMSRSFRELRISVLFFFGNDVFLTIWTFPGKFSKSHFI
jgi:hypothetical protein